MTRNLIIAFLAYANLLHLQLALVWYLEVRPYSFRIHHRIFWTLDSRIDSSLMVVLQN